MDTNEILIYWKVKELFNVLGSYKSIYGLKFKALFQKKDVYIEVVTLNGRCELGICSYSNELEENKELENKFTELENALNAMRA